MPFTKWLEHSCKTNVASSKVIKTKSSPSWNALQGQDYFLPLPSLPLPTLYATLYNFCKTWRDFFFLHRWNFSGEKAPRLFFGYETTECNKAELFLASLQIYFSSCSLSLTYISHLHLSNQIRIMQKNLLREWICNLDNDFTLPNFLPTTTSSSPSSSNLLFSIFFFFFFLSHQFVKQSFDITGLPQLPQNSLFVRFPRPLHFHIRQEWPYIPCDLLFPNKDLH